ncbi:hypothetical protein BDZ91DRAFT_773568 [Kalaharituber pfeilii]|nr:hypothetical protein BDZ91DRAFT_773568 [Kalaharituber pfeilii]
MREVNFSIPNVNKASVGITTALYDRRALDCTSTLPLINSLTHLVYLTTSSARIRDILTVDGGVERLVNILKAGRSKDIMVTWMWNLAFQCVVNIGVRGSETVRTRVVEADMVPVIATILDNYIRVIEKVRSKAEANAKKHAANTLRTRESKVERPDRERIHRRQPPPAIEIPLPFPRSLGEQNEPRILAPAPAPNARYQLSQIRSQDSPSHLPLRSGPSRASTSLQPTPTGPSPSAIDVTDGFVLMPVRDIDRLPSMLPGGQNGGPSQPGSPTTPHTLPTVATRTTRRSGRPSIRHQRSMSGESDDANNEDIAPNVSDRADNPEPIVDIQANLETMDGQDGILEPVETQMGAENQESDTFNITHRSPLDGSMMNHATPVNPAISFSPVPTITVPSVVPHPPNYPRFLENPSSPVVLPSMPREEDVLLSLQLLAYVSKYCNLRTYFQKSHLVPNLSISNEIHLLDEDPVAIKNYVPLPVQEEYLIPDDYNIFPLVEKFTVRHHPPEMQYWAGVDDSRGGIRQCAYYECGKWEQYTRQFAKCRRCRRTKYCSKECQKSAWVYHRHWCVAAAQQ